MAEKFYICRKCGNIVGVVKHGGGALSCCGAPMEALVAGAVDAAKEKHVPVVNYDKAAGVVTVTVGSTLHPMQEEHSIEWIHLQTEIGGYMRRLNPGDKPEAQFKLSAGEKPQTAFAYCNLHGLWKQEIA